MNYGVLLIAVILWLVWKGNESDSAFIAYSVAFAMSGYLMGEKRVSWTWAVLFFVALVYFLAFVGPFNIPGMVIAIP